MHQLRLVKSQFNPAPTALIRNAEDEADRFRGPESRVNVLLRCTSRYLGYPWMVAFKAPGNDHALTGQIADPPATLFFNLSFLFSANATETLRMDPASFLILVIL